MQIRMNLLLIGLLVATGATECSLLSLYNKYSNRQKTAVKFFATFSAMKFFFDYISSMIATNIDRANEEGFVSNIKKYKHRRGAIKALCESICTDPNFDPFINDFDQDSFELKDISVCKNQVEQWQKK